MKSDTDADINVGSIWRHKKRGSVYEVVGFCIIEHSMEIGVLYKMTEADTEFLFPWCRPLSEFKDGRYELVE